MNSAYKFGITFGILMSFWILGHYFFSGTEFGFINFVAGIAGGTVAGIIFGKLTSKFQKADQ